MLNPHLAAPVRYYPSPMITAIIRAGILTPEKTHLDYGCGYGFDVQWLNARGYSSQGYDPYYFPVPVQPADIVTLNYVLNVIQCPRQRSQTLVQAFDLAQESLVISCPVRFTGESVSDRGVFQKSFQVNELRAYIETTLLHLSRSLGKDKFIVDRTHPIKVYSQPEVDRLIMEPGFACPPGSAIVPYSTGLGYRYYRLINRQRLILNPNNGRYVKVLSLGHKGSKMYHWAVDALVKGNRLSRAKFHCIGMPFLPQFRGNKSWAFLVDDFAGVPRDL